MGNLSEMNIFIDVEEVCFKAASAEKFLRRKRKVFFFPMRIFQETSQWMAVDF